MHSDRSGDAYFIGSAHVRSYTKWISDTNIELCFCMCCQHHTCGDDSESLENVYYSSTVSRSLVLL